MRPGIWRLKASRVAKKAACGPPKPSGTPNRCALPRATSPEHAGGRNRVRLEQISGDGHQGAGVVSALDKRFVVVDVAERVRVLQEAAEDPVVELELAVVADDDLEVQRPGAGFDHGNGLRMTRGGNEKDGAARFEAVEHGHRLGGGGGLVEHEALATSKPVRSLTMVWKLSNASRRPWEISA
jgi:hypothetical protein